MDIKKYKNIGVSSAAVFTILAIGTSMWWNIPKESLPTPESQHEAELILSIINRDAAMVVTDNNISYSVGILSNLTSSIKTNFSNTPTNMELGIIYTPDLKKWTAWDTNAFFKGDIETADEIFSIVATGNKVFTNTIGLINTPGPATFTLKHYKNGSPSSAFWRKEPPMGISSTYWTFWYGTETIISGTNKPVVVTATLHPYHTTGFPSGGGGYPTTTPVSDNYGVIKLTYKYGSTYTNTIGLYPNSNYKYADLIRAMTYKTSYIRLWNYWLVPSNTFMKTGKFDGNFNYDPSSFYMSNFGSDITPMKEMWTNWVTLPTRNISVTTNYASTNIVGSVTNIYYHMTNYLSTATNQEVFYPTMTFAFERDKFITPFISTNAYNDLGRFISLLQWQLDNSVQNQSLYYSITLDVFITGTPAIVRCVTQSTITAAQQYYDSYLEFNVGSDAPPGYHYTNSSGTLNYHGYQAVITNRTPFALTNGFFWNYVGNWWGIGGYQHKLTSVNPYPSSIDDLWSKTNKISCFTPWFGITKLEKENWTCPAYGWTNSNIIGYTPTEITNLFPQFIAVVQSFKDNAKSYYDAGYTTNRDTYADAFPFYAFSQNSKDTNGAGYKSHGNDFATYRIVVNDNITNYINHTYNGGAR